MVIDANTPMVNEGPAVLETATRNPATSEELRNVRLSYLNRDSRRPIRYRHSIGSPSLSVISSSSSQATHTTTSNEMKLDDEDCEAFGTDEVMRFFDLAEDEPVVVPEQIQDEDVQTTTDESVDLREVLAIYRSRLQGSEKTLIVQRDNHRFWPILFRQKFDLSNALLNGRFAGEAAADAGGPLREFLTLAMKRIPESSVIFGSVDQICFNSNPEALLSNTYYKLGQLTGLSVITHGRGPECLHPAIVRAMYKVDQPMEMEEVDDGLIKQSLAEISNGNYDCLHEMGVSTIGKTASELARLYLIAKIVHSKYSAIDQFQSGLGSISKDLVKSSAYKVMRQFLECRTATISFASMASLFNYVQLSSEEGSNQRTVIEQCVVEFEMFLAAIESKEIMLNEEELMTYEHILFFCTGVDRVPPYGFEKLIDVTFQGTSLPTASTCALELVLPVSVDCLYSEVIREKMAIALNLGGGFGNV